MRGRVKFYNDAKGYGFLRRDGESDVFFHISKVYSTDDDLQKTVPQLGDEVEFDVATDKKSGREQATNIYLRERAS
jgi:CspA family cold shock protein